MNKTFQTVMLFLLLQHQMISCVIYRDFLNHKNYTSSHSKNIKKLTNKVTFYNLEKIYTITKEEYVKYYKEETNEYPWWQFTQEELVNKKRSYCDEVTKEISKKDGPEIMEYFRKNDENKKHAQEVIELVKILNAIFVQEKKEVEKAADILISIKQSSVKTTKN